MPFDGLVGDIQPAAAGQAVELRTRNRPRKRGDRALVALDVARTELPAGRFSMTLISADMGGSVAAARGQRVCAETATIATKNWRASIGSELSGTTLALDVSAQQRLEHIKLQRLLEQLHALW